MTLLEMFRRFVSPQKACDKEAGVDLLNKFESLPLKETKEFGFSLVETAMILQVMVDHQKRLRRASEAFEVLSRLYLSNSKPQSDPIAVFGGAGGI
jgi:hypothetical protein